MSGYNIVPDFTTSSCGLNTEHNNSHEQYCSVAAISWHRIEYTHHAISFLPVAGVETSIHYIPGQNSIDKTLARLKNEGFNPALFAQIKQSEATNYSSRKEV